MKKLLITAGAVLLLLAGFVCAAAPRPNAPAAQTRQRPASPSLTDVASAMATATSGVRYRLSGDTALNPNAAYFYAVRPAAHRIGAKDQWRDAAGVRIIYVNGKAYQHPAIQAQDGLWALGTYYSTGDPASLALAEAEGARLISTHVTVGSAWWEPYRYPFALYGDAHDVDQPPWYSGLTQGQVLDLFSRLYVVTGDMRWAVAARATFASFLAPQRAHAPWVTRVDERGYLWFEEYPTPRPDDDTVNGHMFAVLGLASYYAAMRDPRALPLIDGGIATTLYALPLIRRPGGMMTYSLSRPTILAGPFHGIVVALCRALASLTGDARFAAWAATFQRDYPTTYP